MDVSIVIPVIRPKKFKNCLDAIKADGFKGQIVSDVDFAKIGCPKMFNELARKATGDIICFLGDDTIPRPGWLEAGLDKMMEFPDGWGVVGLGTEPGNFHAHWMAHRRMLTLMPDGVFFSEEYGHSYCDDELRDIAMENGRWNQTDAIVLDHDHPVNGAFADAHYLRAYDDIQKHKDKMTYIRRKRDRIQGLAIGFPLVDRNIPVEFFLSYACMEKVDSYNLIVPVLPHGQWTGTIADARNSIIEQAQMSGAKWLLMCDTDQVYPKDTLKKLIAHDVDVCGVLVHRRYPPYDPIFYRGKLGEYLSVPEDEMFSGELIEVDATGTGCLLFKMEIFDTLSFPWFSFSTINGKPVGEDIYFCSKARSSNKRIFVDTSIEVGHLVTIEVNEAMHKVCKKFKITEA